MTPEQIAAANGWVRSERTGRWIKDIDYEICCQCAGHGKWFNGVAFVDCEQCQRMGTCLASVNRQERELTHGRASSLEGQ